MMTLDSPAWLVLLLQLVVVVFGGGKMFQRLDTLCRWKDEAEKTLRKLETRDTRCPDHDNVCAKVENHSERLARLEERNGIGLHFEK